MACTCGPGQQCQPLKLGCWGYQDASDQKPTTTSPAKEWHPRAEMRWRAYPDAPDRAPVLEQSWQCPQTGELWWRRVPRVVAWESGEP